MKKLFYKSFISICLILYFFFSNIYGHFDLDAYNIKWKTPSKNSWGSMPLGNGDIGLNVWVEQNGDLQFYIAKSDAWSDNSCLLKLGKIRININPNPFQESFTFEQTLNLLPAWPKEWDVDFKLHAPYNTVVEGKVRDGKIEYLHVQPQGRKNDIVIGS